MVQVKDGGGLDEWGLGQDREKWAIQGLLWRQSPGFADASGGSKRKECEQKRIDLESETAG